MAYSEQIQTRIYDPLTGKYQRINTFGASVAVEMTALVSTTFYENTSITNNYTASNVIGTGSAAITPSQGYFVISSGTTVGSAYVITSIGTGIYNGINPLLYLGGIRLPQAPTVFCKRRWGAYNTADGYYFEDTNGLKVVSRKNNDDIAVSSGSFNGAYGASYVLDQNSHVYEIEITGGKAIFMIDQIVLHTISVASTAITSAGNLNLPIRIEIVNQNTTNMTIEGREQSIARLGPVNNNKRINESVKDNDSATLAKSVVFGKTAADTYNPLTVKEGSTAAAAIDTPLVVALHPSSPTPNFASPQAVTGFPASQAVTGTFFPAVQPVMITQAGIVSTVNSTTANLAASAVFTGAAEDVSNYSSIKVTIFSSHASATDGLSIQQSPDGTNWDTVDTYSIPAMTTGQGKTFGVSVSAKFFRVVYTNGATLTTALRIQSIFSVSNKQPSSVRPQDNRPNDNDFVEMLSYLMGHNTATNTWSRLKQTAGALETMDVSGRTLIGRYMYSSFRILGTAATPQNIFTIENPAASGKKIAILRLTVQNDSTAALATVSPSIKTSRTTALPTGGTVGTSTKLETAYINTVAIVRNGTAADGGAATAITATAGPSSWTQFVDRQQTAAGFIAHNDNSILPVIVEKYPFVLAAGEALLVQGVLANAATTHFIVNAVWEDFT